MTHRSRLMVVAAAALLSLGAVVMWAATGARGWTRYPSEALAEAQGGADDGGGFGDLFADTGLTDEAGELESVDNEFRFGLLPSGPGRDALSVASVVGPSVVVSALVLWRGRRKRG